MNGYNVLFGGAAVAAISASWSYLRWLWSYVCSFVLVTYRVDGELSPMIAALAMSLSSASVIANALRLRNVRA